MEGKMVLCSQAERRWKRNQCGDNTRIGRVTYNCLHMTHDSCQPVRCDAITFVEHCSTKGKKDARKTMSIKFVDLHRTHPFRLVPMAPTIPQKNIQRQSSQGNIVISSLIINKIKKCIYSKVIMHYF